MIGIRRLARAATTIACLTFLPLAASASSDVQVDETMLLASVNGDEITVRHMLEQFTRRHGGHAKFLGGAAEAKEFLNLIIDDRLLIQEAYLLGMEDDRTAQEMVREFVEKKSSDLLIRREVDDKVATSREEAQAVWEVEFETALRARQIAVDQEQSATEIREAILRGADGEYFARNCSVADSRYRGGNVIIVWGMLEPSLEAEVFALEAGEVSPVMETSHWYEVVHVVDKVRVERPEFDEVASRIDSVLRQRKLEQRRAEYSKELWERYGVVTEDAVRQPPVEFLRLYRSAPETVVARWQGGELTLRELGEESEFLEWATLPPRQADVRIEERLRTTVNAPLAILESERLGLAKEPELAAEIESYQDRVVQSLLLRDKVYRNLSVTDDEAREYFDRNPDRFTQPEERRVAHILVRTEDDAKQVLRELAAGAVFEELAKTRSRHFSTARSGGDLGWITAVKVPPAFRKVLSMNAGDVSEPIESDQGWHVVKLLEIRPARLLDFSEVSGTIKERALESKKLETRKYWVEKLREVATIEIDEDAIAEFVKAHELDSLTDAPAPTHEVPAASMKPHG